jgi:hypothetical protein
LGRALVAAESFSERPRKGITVDDRLVFAVREAGGTISDRYVGWRLSEGKEPAPDGCSAAFRLSRQSIADAAESGMDLEAAMLWIERHSDPRPHEALGRIVADILETTHRVRIAQNVLLAEVEREDGKRDVGFTAGHGIPDLLEQLGGRPAEGFEYPPDEPLAVWGSGDELELQFYYEELPLTQRDLLLSLGAEGDPPLIRFTAEKLKATLAASWSLESLIEAFEILTLQPCPGLVREQLEALV